MKFPILSYNLQGLTARDSSLKLKRFLGDMKPSYQILCVQEYKLRSGSTHLLRQQIWNTTVFYIVLAADGQHALRNDSIPTRCGGAFIAIAPKLMPYIIQHDTILGNQGVWIHMQHPEFGPLGIANNYAPNSTAARITL